MTIEILDVVADLLNGGRHSRRTVARAFQVSLPTADRWLVEIERRIPGIVRTKVSKTAWLEWPVRTPAAPAAGRSRSRPPR